MKVAPRVSIIVNNYNYAPFLAQAVDSALAQTWPQIEVIVVDDGSCDDSRKILKAYDSRIKPIYKENGGQPSAINAGFACCQGEIILFLDADDRLLPDAAQAAVDAFQTHPEAAKVHFRMEVIDERGEPTGLLKPAPGIQGACGDLSRQTLTFPLDLRWLPTSGNAFSRSALIQILPMPEDSYGRVGADWYLAHLASLFGPVIFLDQVLAQYRVHAANSYDVPDSALSLPHIRQAIHYSRLTCQYLKKAAKQRGIKLPVEDILPVSEVAHRLISLKLDPPGHPVGGDTRWKLLRLGVTASLRRFDVPFAKQGVFILWFAAMTLAPRAAARKLALFFQDPQSRGIKNFLPGGVESIELER